MFLKWALQRGALRAAPAPGVHVSGGISLELAELWAACLPLGAGVQCSSNPLPHAVSCPASTVRIVGGHLLGMRGVRLWQGSFPNHG